MDKMKAVSWVDVKDCMLVVLRVDWRVEMKAVWLVE